MLDLLCPIKKHAIETPSAPALITDTEVFSYQQLDQKIDIVAKQFQRNGIHRKERAAFLGSVSLGTILTFFALSRLQATACPLNFRLSKSQIEEKLKTLKATFFIDTQTLNASKLNADVHENFVEQDPLFTLLFTSGSSSTPKMAALTFENFYYSALGSQLFLQMKPQHQWLASLPLFHVGGLAIFFRCFLAGAAATLSVLPLEEALTFHKISHLSLVPTQLYRLLSSSSVMAESTFPHLQCILIGGASFSEELYRKARHLPVFPTYGMTEMASQITMDRSQKDDPLTYGAPLPYREVKIQDDGEILVRGKTLFKGYFKNNIGLHLPLEQGWFATKDIGKWTADGKLLVLGRKDCMFISGGENIHPEEVERALCSIESISQAIVVPVADVEFGQRPVAFIQQLGNGPSLDAIKDLLRAKLPPHALPIQIYSLPDSEAMHYMKVSRRSLTELAEKNVKE